jgi:hypothetical protein
MKITPHYLLDYRSMEQLSRMDNGERGELLEKLFEEGPSERAWQGIVELFALWPEGQQKQRYIQFAEQRLAAWDDRLRFVWSANGVLYNGEQLSPLARLVRSIEIYRRGEEGSRELFIIANSEQANQLTYLTIRRSEISSWAWQAMIDSPFLTNLRHLHVRRTLIGEVGAQQLFRSSRLNRLSCLRLSGVGLRRQWLEVAARSIPFSELKSIDFSHNVLGDEGVVLLSEAPWLCGVERIDLQRNYITAPAMRSLISSPFCLRLQQIDLSGNRISEAEKADLIKLAEEKRVHLTI